ncbi:MAG: glycosyltransferase [Saprospiraceae bacterium]|nr:glycosyltransferase [Saprospiraceae bacterium]
MNLKKNLPDLLCQNYNDFEVIVANDFSTDNSENILEQLSSQFKRLKFFNVKKDIPGKKQALIEALNKAANDWILLTDADCVSEGTDWIKSMMNSVKKDTTKIVLGYSPSLYGSKLLSKWSHFETFITAVQYLSFAMKGMPYMGVGRNLLVNKEIFNSGVLKRHLDIAGGDDDLSINSRANASNTIACCTQESFMKTFPPDSWLDYIRQKRRHYSTAHRYRLNHIILLSLYSLSQVGFYLGTVVLLVYYPILSLTIVFFRLVLVTPVAKSLIKKLNSPLPVLLFIVFDFLQAVYYTIFSFAVLFPKKNTWN